MKNFISNHPMVRVAGAKSAAQTEILSDVVDMRDVDGAVFMVSVNTMTDTAVLTATAQGGNASDGSDAVDLDVSATHTAAGTDGNGKLLAVEVFRPRHRYLRLKVTRGTANSSLDNIIAVLSKPMEAPVTQGDTVLGTAFKLSPAPA